MATGKYGSVSSFLLVAGYNLLSSKPKALSYKLEALTEQSDGMGDGANEHTPTGMSRAEVSQEGAYFDTSAGFLHDMQAGIPGALTPQSSRRVVCMGFAGNTIGEPFLGLEGVFNQDYEVLSTVGALQRANMSSLVSGVAEHGHIVHALGAETADATTEPASSVDNTVLPQRAIPITSSSVANPSVITTPVPHGLVTGETILIAGHSGSTPAITGERTVTVVTPTTFTIPLNVTVGGTGGTFTRGGTSTGYSVYLQWTALTLGGHDAAVVTFRHSVDNSTFVDLVSMTAATAARGAERKTALATTVRRYVAQSLDFTGAGSPTMTYFAGLARL